MVGTDCLEQMVSIRFVQTQMNELSLESYYHLIHQLLTIQNGNRQLNKLFTRSLQTIDLWQAIIFTRRYVHTTQQSYKISTLIQMNTLDTYLKGTTDTGIYSATKKRWNL